MMKLVLFFCLLATLAYAMESNLNESEGEISILTQELRRRLPKAAAKPAVAPEGSDAGVQPVKAAPKKARKAAPAKKKAAAKKKPAKKAAAAKKKAAPKKKKASPKKKAAAKKKAASPKKKKATKKKAASPKKKAAKKAKKRRLLRAKSRKSA